MPLDDVLRELDRMMSRLHALSKQYRPIAESLLSNWNAAGPRADVFPEGDRVRVVVEAPGLSKSRRPRWALRVQDDALHIRGELRREQTVRSSDGRMAGEYGLEQFTRVVPLPYPVERKPESVNYSDGLLTMTFRKRRGFADDGWIDLRF